MSRSPLASENPKAFWGFTFGAIAWSLLLLLLAIVLPIYTVSSNHAGLQPRHSLVRVYGYDVLLMAAAPLVASLVVLGLLYLASSYSTRPLRAMAWVVAIVVEVGAFVGFITFLIGIFVLPVGALLIAACATSSSSARGPKTAPQTDSHTKHSSI